MVGQKKEDIVCAFHGDIEEWMEKIDIKLEQICNNQINLRLWRSRILGWAAGVSFSISILVWALSEIW